MQEQSEIVILIEVRSLNSHCSTERYMGIVTNVPGSPPPYQGDPGNEAI